ncbi:hypothetical protein M0Q28_04930 [Patescibacteria group bacterium]|nr:hypothetical protein [Patescibacteria group bacterium]
MELGHGEVKQNKPEDVWAAREAEAKRAYERKLRMMTPAERAEAIAEATKAQEEKRQAEAAARVEEAKLKEALSQVGKSAKPEDIKQTSEKLGKAIEALGKGEDEAYLVYLQTKTRELEKKIQKSLMEGMINETDSEALADWKQKLADHEAKMEAEKPYEEITIEPWKKAN